MVFVVPCAEASATAIWAKQGGGSSADYGYSVAYGDGKVFFTGFFQGSAAFGSTSLISAGNVDVFTVALSATDGSYLWAKRAGGSSTDYGEGVAYGDGKVFITGVFAGSAAFGSTSLASNFWDVFTVALSATDGSYLWAKNSGGGSDYDRGQGVAYGDGKVFITGYFEGLAAFGSTSLISAGDWDVFTVALSATDGSYLWAKRAGGSGNDRGQGVAYGDGKVFFTGFFSGSAAFGSTSLISAGDWDVFTVALSATDGSYLWAKRAGGSGSDQGSGVAYGDGKVFFTGFFSGSAAFGSTSLISAGSGDVFTVALSATDGSYLWAERASGSGDDRGRDVAYGDGKVLITGHFYGSAAAFGSTSLISAGSYDVFTVALSATDGSYLWAERAGGSGNDRGQGVAYGDGKVVVTGHFQGSAGFGSTSLISAGNVDVFTAAYLPPCAADELSSMPGLNSTSGASSCIDITPPVAAAYSPTQGATSVSANANIVISFNENVQAGSGNVVISPDTGPVVTIAIGDVQVGFAGAVVTIDPTNAFSTVGMRYTVTMASGVITDTSASPNAFAGLSGLTYQFTVADTTPPTITVYLPAQGATEQALSTQIVLTFSESVQAGSGNVVITPATGTAITIAAGDAQMGYSGATVTIDPSDAFSTVGMRYTVTMASGVITDTSSSPNAFAGLSGLTYQFNVADTTPPTITVYVPAQGATGQAPSIQIVLTFSESVQSGTGDMVLTPGSGPTIQIPATDAQVAYSTNTVTISPSSALASETFAVTMASGVIQDASGNAFTGLSGTTFQFSVDADAPVIVTFAPTQGATNIAADANIVITFNENVQAGSGNVVMTPATGASTTIAIGDGQVGFSGAVVTINPTNTFSTVGIEYTVTMASGVIKDASTSTHDFGGLSGSTYRFAVADTTPPTITAYSPIQESTGQSPSTPIVLTFSESVQSGTGNMVLTSATDTVSIPAGDTQVSYSATQVTINPSGLLTEGSLNTVTMPSGVIIDASSNAFAGLSGATYQFTVDAATPTAAPTAPTVPPTAAPSSVAPGTPSGNASPTSSEGSDTDNSLLMIAISAGAAVAVILIILFAALCWYFWCRKPQAAADTDPDQKSAGVDVSMVDITMGNPVDDQADVADGSYLDQVIKKKKKYNEPGHWDVFFSHSRRSGHGMLLATELCTSLQEHGKTGWLDVKMANQSVEAMMEGVKNSKCVIAVVNGPCIDVDEPATPEEKNAFFNRDYCQNELRWAVEAGVPIQPVIRIEDKKKIGEFLNQAPADLQHLAKVNWITLDRNDNDYWEVGVKKVLAAMDDLAHADAEEMRN